MTVIILIFFLFALDDLVQQRLGRIPQYNQVYPAAKPDVSASIEEMINRGFPPNQNIVWHKATHSQKRYYWIMKPNADDEVRVRVSNGGICGKAGTCQSFSS
jgi:hypothetical protein